MEKDQAQNLISRLRKQGYKAKMYEGYSGRGMYGDRTFGVVTDKRPDRNTKFRTDNMGLDYIYY